MHGESDLTFSCVGFSIFQNVLSSEILENIYCGIRLAHNGSASLHILIKFLEKSEKNKLFPMNCKLYLLKKTAVNKVRLFRRNSLSFETDFIKPGTTIIVYYI